MNNPNDIVVPLGSTIESDLAAQKVADAKPTEDVRLLHEGHKVWAVAYRDGTELGRIRVARQYLDRDLTPERQGAFFEDIAIALKRKINRPVLKRADRRTVLAGVLK